MTRGWLAAALAAAVLLGAARSGAAPQAGPIAVMPFRNLNGDAATDWLRAGIAETMITDLKKSGSATVVERSQIEQALAEMKLQAEQEVDAAQAARIGKLVGAKTIVLGAYQQSGKQVRINARFVAVETGVVLDTAKVTGSIDRIFELQDAIVDRMLGRPAKKAGGAGGSGAKGSAPSRPARKSGPKAVEAYRLYAMSLTTATDAQRAEYLEMSLAIDPDFVYAREDLDALEKRVAALSREASKVFDARERELRKTVHDEAAPNDARVAAALQLMGRLFGGKRIHTLLRESRRIQALGLEPNASGDAAEYASQWEFQALERLHRIDEALQAGERHLQRFPGGVTYTGVESRVRHLADQRRRELAEREAARKRLAEIAEERKTAIGDDPKQAYRRLLLDYQACLEATKVEDLETLTSRCDAYFAAHGDDTSETAAQFTGIARYYVVIGLDRLGEFERGRPIAEDLLENGPDTYRSGVRMFLDNWPADAPAP